MSSFDFKNLGDNLKNIDLQQVNGFFHRIDSYQRINSIPWVRKFNIAVTFFMLFLFVMVMFCCFNNLDVNFKKIQPKAPDQIKYYVDTYGYPYYKDANGNFQYPYQAQSDAAAQQYKYQLVYGK